MNTYILLFLVIFIILLYILFDFKYFENFLNINSNCNHFCRNVGKHNENDCLYFNNNESVKCLNDNNQLVNANCFYNNRNQCVFRN